jgi:hypothetical protein
MILERGTSTQVAKVFSQSEATGFKMRFFETSASRLRSLRDQVIKGEECRFLYIQ